MHVVRGLWLPWWPTLWWEHRGRLLVADLLQLIGIGGAFTEAAAFNWHKLSEPQQRAVMRAYFAPAGEGGHAYAIGRHSAPEELARRLSAAYLPLCMRSCAVFIVANSRRKPSNAFLSARAPVHALGLGRAPPPHYACTRVVALRGALSNRRVTIGSSDFALSTYSLDNTSVADEIAPDRACVPQAAGFCSLTHFDDALLRDHRWVRTSISMMNRLASAAAHGIGIGMRRQAGFCGTVARSILQQTNRALNLTATPTEPR